MNGLSSRSECHPIELPLVHPQPEMISTKIPFLELRPGYLELREEIDEAVSRVLNSGHYILGPEVEAFEEEFAHYCGARFAIGVADGLDALHLSLLALGVEAGDEVIVPSNTFIATWLAVSQCGATPVPVEPDPRTHNLDPTLVARALSPRTKVILPVHLYGQPADLDPILELARDRGIHVLEDAAQAHGAKYKGRRLGTHGDAVAWSFYPGKNLGALGDGGAVTTDNAAIAERIRLLRNYGSRVKYVNEAKGFNSRLDPLHAAVLRIKLRHLDEWNSRRSKIAELYLGGLAGSGVTLPVVPTWADPAWHLFVVRHAQRDQLQSKLAEAGIQTLIHYPIPPHRQMAYAADGGGNLNLPIACELADQVLSLPMGPHISAAEAETVVTVLCRSASTLASSADS